MSIHSDLSSTFKNIKMSLVSKYVSSGNVLFSTDPSEVTEMDFGPSKITSAHIRQVGYELGIVQTCWPEIYMPEFERRTHFPESYYKNSDKEKLALMHAENFRQQFHHLLPDRRAIILAVENGCGIQKLVCNTLRPTTLPYLELKQWKGAAKFVSDYIKYEPLDSPTLPPERILGPYTVGSRQLGHCFEMANVLCSLLLGAGYDAYVVFGTATQDITTNVRYRTQCPIKTELPEEEVIEEELTENKYKLREIRDLRSQFLLYMVQRDIDRAEAKRKAQLEKEFIEQTEREKAPPDDLHGWRIHAWVLLLPKLDVTEPTFVETSTGVPYPITTDVYLKVESIWNNFNYWVNMQDCSEGIANLKYDLKDVNCWEHLFLGEPMEHRTIQIDPEADIDENTVLDEKHLDAPTSWSEPIVIPHDIHIYTTDKDNSIEAPRSLDFYYDFRLDGLSKLEVDALYIKEYFKNREDNLFFRHATFAERGKPPPGMVEGTRRIVISITEKFHRDPSKDAHHDIAVRIFNLVENSIHIQYHYAKGHVTASTRNFMKPKVADRNDELMFNPDLTTGYQAEIGAKSSKQLQLYYLMTQQIKDEQSALYHLREIEDEVITFVRTRAIETAVPQLEVSLFNREQNDEYKIGLKEKEEQQRMFQVREVDEDIDYLTPYLVRVGATTRLDKNQANRVKEDCLREFKELLTTRANTLRNKFEKEYQEYLRKQQWFSTNMSVLRIEDEEKTLNEISNQKYLLHMYDIRLRRHLELSHSRYRALETYLDLRPILAAVRKLSQYNVYHY